jgi:hypothetical protein
MRDDDDDTQEYVRPRAKQCCTHDCDQGRNCPARKTQSNPLETAMGWRKRQVQPVGNEIIDKIRNDTLEEVAKEFDQMKAFGTTAESFACYVRDMKAKT